RHGLELGVTGAARAAGRDQPPGPQPGGLGPGRHHDPGRGVTERYVTGQPLPHRAGGRADPFGTGLADHLADQVRAGPRLGAQARPPPFRTVRVRRGNGPSARHTSSGASAVSPNPLAAAWTAPASRTPALPVTRTRNSPGQVMTAEAGPAR